MTYNVVALTEELPHARSMIRALKKAHPDFTTRGANKASMVHLRDEEEPLRFRGNASNSRGHH